MWALVSIIKHIDWSEHIGCQFARVLQTACLSFLSPPPFFLPSHLAPHLLWPFMHLHNSSTNCLKVMNTCVWVCVTACRIYKKKACCCQVCSVYGLSRFVFCYACCHVWVPVCVCACSRLGVSDWKHFRNLTIVSRAQDGHASFTDPPACVFVYRFWPHAAIFSQKVLFAELRSLHACKQTCHPPNRTHTHPHSLPVLFSACPHHCVIFLFPAWSLTLFLFCLFLF